MVNRMKVYAEGKIHSSDNDIVGAVFSENDIKILREMLEHGHNTICQGNRFTPPSLVEEAANRMKSEYPAPKKRKTIRKRKWLGKIADSIGDWRNAKGIIDANRDK